MKKYLSLLLACVLALALLCACGGKDAAEQTPAPETPPTQTAAAGGVDTSCNIVWIMLSDIFQRQKNPNQRLFQNLSINRNGDHLPRNEFSACLQRFFGS